jgi:hypothetical protein
VPTSEVLNVIFRDGYWGDRELKAEFMSFMIPLLGLDLSVWNDRGFWDDRSRPFSFFDGDRLVSNVCVYLMDMVVLGRR